jgi:GTP-binding protein EngB required for normal cell division
MILSSADGHEYEEDTGEDENGQHILIIGETGIGKSTLINSLVDRKELIASEDVAMTKDMLPDDQGNGTTTDIKDYALKKMDGILGSITLWDTPGLSNQQETSIASVTTLLREEFGPAGKQLSGVLVVQPSVQSNTANLGVAFLQKITEVGFFGEGNENKVILVGTKADQCTRGKRDYDNFQNIVAKNFFRSILQDDGFVPERGTHFVHTKLKPDEQFIVGDNTIDVIDTTELEQALRKCMQEGKKGHFNIESMDLVDIAKNCLKLTEDQVQQFVDQLKKLEQSIEDERERNHSLQQTVQEAHADQAQTQLAHEYQEKLQNMTRNEVRKEVREWKKQLPHPRNMYGLALLCTGDSQRQPRKDEMIKKLVLDRFPAFKFIIEHANKKELPPGWTKQPHVAPSGTYYTYHDADQTIRTESMKKAWEKHLEREQPEDEVEDILDKKVEGGVAFYLIKWRNYDSADNSWLPLGNLDGSKGLITKFESKLRKAQSPRANTGTTPKRRKMSRKDSARK